MEDSPNYRVTILVTPPARLSELTPFAQTTEAGQQQFYEAGQVEKVLAANEAIIGCHAREIAALRRYIDVFHQELLAHPELPESIQKVVYAHRQTLTIAHNQALHGSKECNNCGGLGCASCHGGTTEAKLMAAYAQAKEYSHTSYQLAWETLAAAVEKEEVAHD